MPEQTYLLVRGILSEDLVYRPRPGLEADSPGRRAPGEAPPFEPELLLVLLDREGRTLSSVVPEAQPGGCGVAEDPLRVRVRGALPLHRDGVAYEVRRGDQTVHRAQVTPAVPHLTGAGVQEVDGNVVVRWEPVDREPMDYAVALTMETGRRLVLGRGLTEPAYLIEVGRLPVAGTGTVSVIAGDGVRSTETQIGRIDVPVRPPEVHIIAPTDRARVRSGEPVSLLGTCLDMGGAPCPAERLVWLLNDEPIAAGHSVAVIEHAEPGWHRLTLAYGEGGDRVERSVDLEVLEPDETYQEWVELVANGDAMFEAP